MKRLLIILLIISLPISCFGASSFTTYLRLEKPAHGRTIWDEPYRDTMDTIDGIVGPVIDVGGYIDASGTATFADTIDVAGDANFQSDITVGGDLTDLNSALDVSGTTTLADTLDVTGAAVFRSDLSVTGDADITGDMSVTGDSVDINAALDVSGTTTLSDYVDLNSYIDVSGTAAIAGAVNLNSTLSTGGKITATNYNKDSNVWTVGDTACDATTITAGLALASAGDAVVVYPGDYAETVVVSAGVSLIGVDKYGVVIGGASYGDTSETIVELRNNSSISNISIIDRYDVANGTGAAIGIASSVTGSCTITDIYIDIKGDVTAPTVAVHSVYSYASGANIKVKYCDFNDSNSDYGEVAALPSDSIKSLQGTGNIWDISYCNFNTNRYAFTTGSTSSETVTIAHCTINSQRGIASFNSEYAIGRINNCYIHVQPEDCDAPAYGVKGIAGGALTGTDVRISNSYIYYNISQEDAADLSQCYIIDPDEARLRVKNCAIEVYGKAGVEIHVVHAKPGTSGYNNWKILNTSIEMDGVGTQYSFYHDDPNAGHPEGAMYIGNCNYDRSTLYYESSETHYDTRYYFISSGDTIDAYDTLTIRNSTFNDTFCGIYRQEDELLVNTLSDTCDFGIQGRYTYVRHPQVPAGNNYLRFGVTGTSPYFAGIYSPLQISISGGGHLRVMNSQNYEVRLWDSVNTAWSNAKLRMYQYCEGGSTWFYLWLDSSDTTVHLVGNTGVNDFDVDMNLTCSDTITATTGLVIPSGTILPTTSTVGAMFLDTDQGGADGTLYIWNDGEWQPIADLN